MKEYAPIELALDWDNVGFLVGESSEPIQKILVSLDLTDEVLEEAIMLSAGLVITHHPVIFKPITRVTDESPLGRRIIKLIKHGIAVYSAHTNLDMCNGGTNDVLFDALGLVNKQGLEEPDQHGFSLGRVGDLPKEMFLEELGHMIKTKLNLPVLNYAGDSHSVVKRVGLCTGSSAGIQYFNQAIKRNCQVYVTGDLTYHMAQAAIEMGLCVIDATHYATEAIVSKTICDYIREKALDNGYEIIVIESETNTQTLRLV